MTQKTYRELFEAHAGRDVTKWDHYFELYDRYLGPFRDRPITMMEIGVGYGGSLELWRAFLGPHAKLVGIDINPGCKAYGGEGIEIFIGDQGNPDFMRDVAEKTGPFDIILDDGSHLMGDLRSSFLTLFGAVKPGGLYIAEDLHTCYWRKFGGGHRVPESFLEDLKGVIDHMHACHSEDPETFAVSSFTLTVKGMYFHDSMAVIEKTMPWENDTRPDPRPVFAGRRGSL